MQYIQDNRICSLKTPLKNDSLLIRSLTGHEGISELFRFELDLLGEGESLDFAELIGKPVVVQLDLSDGESRFFHGIVARFSQGEADRRFVSYRAEVVPTLWLLSRKTDCRVFPQDWTTQQIIEKIFSEFGITDFEFRLGGPSVTRHYCVQYRETSLAFFSRLLEEDGLHYFFKHSEEGHQLVIADDSSLAEDCPGQAEAIFQDGASGISEEDCIESWQVEQELHTGGCALGDYNFETPSTDLRVGVATSTPVGGNEGLEHFDYHPREYPDVEGGEKIARVRMEEQEAAAVLIRGSSSCRAFNTGYRFKLLRHYREDYDEKLYLLTSVHHRLRQPADYESGGETTPTTYENSFVCIPQKTIYRPARVTPKPVVLGPQTALVVGPEGEEIHVDSYGRIKVRFFWDRFSPYDGSLCCWVRVSQGWAGKNWGMMHLPRVGQEVIVDFLEGDPDKPMVTGRVYNAEQMPPYTLPDNKTQSGIKSRSTPEGGPSNFNEMRFEDKKGSEEFFQQAEKNMTVLVKGSRSETVGGSVSTSAGGPISRASAKDISRTADGSINDKAAGSYSLLTNQGIHLKTVHAAYEAITAAWEKAKSALKSGDAAGAAESAGTAAETGMDTANAMASQAANAADGAAGAAGAGAGKVGAALQGLGTAIAAGAASEVLADKLLAAVGAADGASAELKKLLEGLLPEIPSIVMWAMKNYQVQALWQISMSAKYNSVSIESEKKDVSIKAKKQMQLEASEKDFNLTAGKKDINVKASKENINVTAKKKISIKAEDEDLVIEAGQKKVFIKAAKQIFLKCGKASISLAESGNIVISGNKININGKAPVQIKGKPIKLN